MKKHLESKVILFSRIALVTTFSILNISSCKKSSTSSLPVLTTNTLTGITDSTAVSGGNITDGGSSAIDSRGVCWSTSADPTTSAAKTVDGSGEGSFTSDLTGLNPATTYHVRAYATNQTGTAYGNDLSFTTQQAGQTSHDVTIQNFAFTPQTLTVPVNTTVTWTNMDAVTHTVTSDSGVFTSGNMATNGTFSFKFTAAGTYPYHCSIHTYMTASIVVQ